jgi:hypothetical protein
MYEQIREDIIFVLFYGGVTAIAAEAWLSTTSYRW